MAINVLSLFIIIRGGVGIASNHKDDFIMPNGAEAGDYLILTKPLGV